MINSKQKVDWKAVFDPASLFYIIAGVFCAAIALKAFMLPNKFLDGGVTGIAIIVNLNYGTNLNLLLVLINIPFLWIGWKKIGKTFAIQSSFSVFLLVLVLEICLLYTSDAADE